MRVMPILGLVLHMRDRDRDPRAFSSGALSISSNAVNVVFGFPSANTFVIAAVNVVFP